MIKNLVFDVGDVLLAYRWPEMLKEHGMSEEKIGQFGEMVFGDPLWYEFDYGIKNHEEILAAYKEKYPENYADIEWFITHGELMPVDRSLRKELWDRVHELKEKGYKIYILSNYSEYLFKKHTDGAAFLKDMDGIVVSYMIHKAKPDPAIYQYLLDTYQLKAEESIFFDDKPANTAAAMMQGMKAVTVKSQKHLMESLAEF